MTDTASAPDPTATQAAEQAADQRLGPVDETAAPDPTGLAALSGNVADLLAATAERVPDRLALIDAPTGQTLTWSQVHTQANQVAAAIRTMGVTPGDRVAIRLVNGIPFAVAAFAVLRAGAVLVPIHPELPPLAVAELVADCGAALLIGDPVEGTTVPTLPAPNSPDQATAEAVAEFDAVGGGEDIAVLGYTSGTSGRPRGVLLSHRALLANVAQCRALRPAPVVATDRVLLSLPLTHAYGLGPGLLQLTAAGAAGVLLPRFTVDEALAAAHQYRVTMIAGVPQMYQALLTVPEESLREALSSVRLLTSGAAPLEPLVLASIRSITGLSVYEGYGLTETGPVLTSTLVTGYAKPGSVGQALPGVRIRLVDDTGEPLQARDEPDEPEDLGDDGDDTGFVSVAGPNLFSGYWPDRAGGPDAEGWFRTGDIGYLDADGDLHLIDRANDLIIVNGFNVYPHEVEHVLTQIPEVAQAAVVGVSDAKTGQAVRAVLVVAQGVEITAADVIAYCSRWLARFKVPTIVEFAADLPHSVTGKLSRSALR
jgi:long-chain acyl-CoA synthetase